MQYILETDSLQIPRRRFQFPLARLLPLFDGGSSPVCPSESIEQAIANLTLKGKEFSKVMGSLRRTSPVGARELLRDSDFSFAFPWLASAREFSRIEVKEVVFRVLTDPDRDIFARTLDSMLILAFQFYLTLYAVPTLHISDEQLNTYLDQLNAGLNPEEVHDLDKDFTLAEMDAALKCCHENSAPGPDGIQFSVLRWYWGSICSVLVRTANKQMRSGQLPQAFRDVLVTIVPKISRDRPTALQSFRPVMLTNCCLRVVSQAANSRIQPIADTVVGPLQREFMSSRSRQRTQMETRAHISLMAEAYRTGKKIPPELAIYTEAITEPFDRVSHEYIRNVLARLRFGPKITNLIMLITSGQYAQIYLNHCTGAAFPLLCGVRHGNPVLPILFNIALEPYLHRLQGR